MSDVATLDTLRPALFDAYPHLVAGFSTRAGGVSPAPFGALNLGMSTDDADENVAENRRRFFGAHGYTPEHLAVAFQVHGNNVATVDRPGGVPDTDGLVTATPGVVLAIVAADCTVVLLADPEANVIGACHSGWRGTVGAISQHTVRAMERLGARAERLQAWISPCISAERFEVGPEVAAQFEARFVAERPDWPRPHIDLKAVIADQLTQAGVPEAHVETSPHCTMGDTDRFFSHRAENGRTGRMMGFIALR